MTSAIDPLARLRHDLRTPASHILGYAELVRESATELGLSTFLPDLARIEQAGKRLVEVIRDQLAPEMLASGRLQLRELHADLRTPLNHVTGYGEMLLELAEAEPRAAPLVADLQRIHAAGQRLLRLVEEQLTPAALQAVRVAAFPLAATSPDARALSRSTEPAAVSDSGSASGFGAPQPASKGPRARILVVDDEPGNRDLLARRLRQLGFAVETTNDGTAALEALRASPGFDLLLLDVVMPGLDGAQALARLKADPDLRHLPVIMLSALDEMDSVVRCLLAGAEDYLPKPVNTILLRARIDACLEKGRLRRQEAAYLETIEQERRKSEALLLNILPAPIAHRLKQGETTIVDRLPDVTVLFADLVGFTALSARLDSVELVRLLDEVFTAFDGLAQGQGLEKIKTIGDAYMVVGGLSRPRPDHAEAVAEAALGMLAYVDQLTGRQDPPIQLRLGIHTGPVIAGVIGRHKFNYDLWGDTVNTASRMESASLAGKIQVTEATYQRLKDRFAFTARGVVDIKGKGPMPTWFLEGRLDRGRPSAQAKS